MKSSIWGVQPDISHRVHTISAAPVVIMIRGSIFATSLPATIRAVLMPNGTDIVRSWMGIGTLGAIAVIRTFLNYFLERDVAELRGRQREPALEVDGS